MTSRDPRPAGFCNRSIEQEVARLGGRKSLYSDAYYSKEEFWSLHDRSATTRSSVATTRTVPSAICIRSACSDGSGRTRSNVSRLTLINTV